MVLAGWGVHGTNSVDQQSAATAVARFAVAVGWPVLADPLSGLRQGRLAISTYDALLRHAGFADRHRPDLVLSLGAPLTSAVATAWLDDEVDRILIDPHGAWADPRRSASTRVVADPIALLEELTNMVLQFADHGAEPSPWAESWLAAESQARTTIDTAMDASDLTSEGRVARDLVACLPEGATVVVGSSMPVRDVESFSRPRSGIRFLANRGANGIDGFVSTALGVAAVSSGPVVALCGDLTFLHDSGGLLGATRRHLSVTFVVPDNDGGGIFSFLPQAGSGEEGAARFETLFGTPHGLDLTALAAVHGIDARRVTSAAAFVQELRSAVRAGGGRLLVVPTERAANAERHRRLFESVART
ncbi:MAG: thiamine pyrophosphate-dependent enzyme, partial [Pseudonocardiaceae bacterium]